MSMTTESEFVSIGGVGSCSTRVAFSRLDSVRPVEADAGRVCSTGLSEAGGSEVTVDSTGVSDAVLATVGSRGGSCAGGGTRVGCGPGGIPSTGWSDGGSYVAARTRGGTSPAGGSRAGSAGGRMTAAGWTAAAKVRGAFDSVSLVGSAGAARLLAVRRGQFVPCTCTYKTRSGLVLVGGATKC